MSHHLEAMDEKKHSHSSSTDERRSETKSYKSLGKRHVERGSDEAGSEKKSSDSLDSHASQHTCKQQKEEKMVQSRIELETFCAQIVRQKS